MKIRLGFVSNSSTGSFCLFGAHVDSLDDIRKWDEDNEDEDGYYDSFYTEAGKLDLTFISCNEYDDGYYIGLNWSGVKDEETGAEFKKRASDLIAKYFGKKVKCHTFQGTYPN